VNLTAALFDTLAGDGETKPESASIRASLREQEKQFIGLPWRETAAFVRNLDRDTIVTRARVHFDAAMGLRELERILKQVRQCRREVLAIKLENHVVVDRADRELEASILRINGGTDRYLFDELREHNVFRSLHARLEAYLRDRAIHEVSHRPLASLKHCSGTSTRTHVARFEHFKSDHRDVELVPQLVRKDSKGFHAFLGDSLLTQAPKFGDGFRDGVVEASVQNLKLLCTDRCLSLDGKFRDGLTQASVVVDDLTHAEPHA
jgi:hypothetical protein